VIHANHHHACGFLHVNDHHAGKVPHANENHAGVVHPVYGHHAYANTFFSFIVNLYTIFLG
jgi:hypothetical protein